MKRAAALLLALAAVPPVHAAPGETPIVAASYVVRAGDSFATIARRMGVTQKELAAANALPYPWRVSPGMVLRRPGPAATPAAPPPPPALLPAPAPAPAPLSPSVVPTAKPTPRPAPSPRPPRRPAPPPRPMPSLRPVPEPLPAHAREADAPRLVWPTSGALVGRFGVPVRGRPNDGIDLSTFAGMSVHAAAAGRMVFAGTEPERFGQLIVIDHGNGWTTAYAYLGAISVTEGQQVTQRQTIARIGRSGEAASPTLHFEVRRANLPRDPYAYLPVRL